MALSFVFVVVDTVDVDDALIVLARVPIYLNQAVAMATGLNLGCTGSSI